MRSIAICNLKGGVGKTTTTVNLGASLAEAGKRVLLIDSDPQGSLTRWVRADDDPTRPTLYDVLRGQGTVRGTARETPWENIWVVPSSPRLAEIDRRSLSGERVLWARLSGDWDVALIDCSTTPGIVLGNALTAAREVLVPVQARGMALGGVARLSKLLEEVDHRTHRAAEIAGIVVSQFEPGTRIARLVLGQIRALYRDRVFETLIRDSEPVSEAAECRKPVTVLSPGCRASEDFHALAQELMGREPASRTEERGAAGRVVPRPVAVGSAARAHHRVPPAGPLARR